MENKLPKISIISPVFNIIKSGREPFFRQMIESVHNQTYTNIEHIVQDGGSTDGTIEILKEYADKGWITFYSEKDKNVHDAINKAFDKISGSFFGILGSDDYYKSPDMIEDVVQNFILKTNPDYVYGDQENISATDGSPIFLWRGDGYINEFWRGVSYNTLSMFFSKKMFEEIGRFDINYPVVADLKLPMKMRFDDYTGAYCNRIITVFREGIGLSSQEDTLFYHKNEYAEICYEIWKKFDASLAVEDVEYMIKYNYYPEKFLMRLRRYIIGLKLKNLDYIKFNRYIEEKINFFASSSNKKTEDAKIKQYNKVYIRLFTLFPIVKITRKGNVIHVFLFGFIPVLKIKKS